MWVVSSLNDKYIYLWCLWYITRSESRYLTYDVHLIAFSFGLSVKERRHVELESLNNPHSSRCASDYSLVCLCYTISLDNWLSHWLSYGHGLINRTCNAATRANNYIRTFLTFTLYYIYIRSVTGIVSGWSCGSASVFSSMTSASHHIQNSSVVIINFDEVCLAPDTTYVYYEPISLNKSHSNGLRIFLERDFFFWAETP